MAASQGDVEEADSVALDLVSMASAHAICPVLLCSFLSPADLPALSLAIFASRLRELLRGLYGRR